MALGPLRRSERYAQRTEIADLFGYRIWSEADRPALIEMASLLAKRDVTPTFILIEILAFLKAQKIVRPGYSALQAIVSGGPRRRARAIGPARGCKPKPPKIPSGQIQPRDDRIQVNHLPVVAKGIASIQMDMAPGRRRDLLDRGERLYTRARPVPGQQSGQDGRVVVDDRVRDQSRALVADLDFDVGLAGEFRPRSALSRRRRPASRRTVCSNAAAFSTTCIADKLARRLPFTSLTSA